MAVQVKKNAFDEFFEGRDALFYLYQKGDINKKEFIEEQYYHIQRMGLKPFQKIDSFEKGIYNYQYYNAFAKYNKLKIRDKKLAEKHPELVVELVEKIKGYYRKKDDTLIKLVRYRDFENVEAYFIKSKSEYLNNKLFEVVFNDREGVVFHSINKGILEELKREGVMAEGRKKSKIDDYVNKKY